METMQQLEGLFGEDRPINNEEVNRAFGTLKREFVDFLEAFRHQPQHGAISEEVSALVRDLLYDKDENPVFKTELLRDLQIILPILIDRIQDLPIATIQTADEDYDFLLENIVLHTKHLFPGMFKIKAKSQMKMLKRSPVRSKREIEEEPKTTLQEAFERKEPTDEEFETLLATGPGASYKTTKPSLTAPVETPVATEEGSVTKTASEFATQTSMWTTDVDNSVKIKVQRVKLWANDISFWYKKKTGFPKMSDSGKADLKIHGDRGLSLVIKLSPLLQPQESYLLNSDGSINMSVPPHKSFIRIEKVSCDIDRISLSIRDSRHDFLYRLLAPWLKSYIRDNLIKGIEDQVAKIIFEADAAIAQLVESTLPESAKEMLGLEEGTSSGRRTIPLTSIERVSSAGMKVLHGLAHDETSTSQVS